jgi:hypothetical protein
MDTWFEVDSVTKRWSPPWQLTPVIEGLQRPIDLRPNVYWVKVYSPIEFFCLKSYRIILPSRPPEARRFLSTFSMHFTEE